jgi:autotransporter-associated beta strand protein
VTSGTVTLTRKGTTYSGDFTVKQGMVHLVSALGKKSTQVGHSAPELIAQMMLLELVQVREMSGAE